MNWGMGCGGEGGRGDTLQPTAGLRMLLPLRRVAAIFSVTEASEVGTAG